MDASGQYYAAASLEGVQFFSPAQMSQYSQNPSVHGGPPLFSPMNIPTMPLPPAMSPMPATHIPLQQALGLHPAVMNSLPPGMSLPAPSTPAAASQAIATFHHGPMAEAQPEVMFDPGTPPPFADRAQMQTPRRHGVLKIANIPYTISIPEMHQFISKYLPTSHLIDAHITGYPTHIIMERSTGKTMDCYMELKSPETAAADWEHAFGTEQMRIPKIGQRNVEVTITTQSELMKEIFPRAKCIHWDNENNGAPHLVANRDIYSSGFNGFITTEELTCMARHAENPQRSQFAARSMNRAYECMISTTYKFPWFAATLYTIRQGQEIFKCYKRQLDHLIGRLTSPNMPREVGLDNKLLMDLIFAGLNTAGFSERQKGFIADTCVVVGTGFPVSKHARAWPFQTLSLYPTKLSDQDVGMWLEILNMGMGALEMQGRPFIGISSYLQVIRDVHGQILFLPTEEGLDLKRAQFSILETRMMRELMEYGWNAYLPQMGIEPSNYAMKNSMLANAARVTTSDPSVVVGSSTINPGTGAYTVNEDGHRELASDGGSTYNMEDDIEFIQAGNTGITSESFNDPEKALAAMRQVVNDVREAPPVDQAEVSAGTFRFDAELDGLGAGLSAINLNNPGDPQVARYVPPARRTSNYPILQPVANLNPESPPFEPPVTRPQQGNGPAPPGGSVFAGRGLGNGDFTTSPSRNSTRRDSSTASNSTVDKGKSKESALTAPAAGVRLQSAPVLGAAFAPNTDQGQTFPQGRVLTYGQTLGQGGEVADVIQAVASSAAQRRGITIRDHRGNIVTAPRLATTFKSNAGSVKAGAGNAPTGPASVLPYTRPRSRPGNAAFPNHGTDGTGRTFDDTLDEWFDEKTDEPTRMAISAGMNMRTASAATLAAPSTPPPRPVPALHRSPAREHLRTGYEFDEALHMSHAEIMPIAPPARPFGTTASAPATPAQPVVRTPRQTVAPTPNSLGYRTVSTTTKESTGGVRLPRSATTGTLNAATPTPNFGVVGDGSPLRRHEINITQTSLTGSPLQFRYNHGENNPEQLAARMAIHRDAILHRWNIGEEDE